VSGHTEGPWKLNWRVTKYEIFSDDEMAGWFTPSRLPEDEANARLIAAAPDLLAELQHLRRLLHPWIESGNTIPGLATLNGADAAIARATGAPPMTRLRLIEVLKCSAAHIVGVCVYVTFMVLLPVVWFAGTAQ